MGPATSRFEQRIRAVTQAVSSANLEGSAKLSEAALYLVSIDI
jgi:hypothetical protein